MRGRISRTAAWGSYLAERRIVPDAVRTAMKSILDEIESGVFAERWQSEASSGSPRLNELTAKESEHPIEQAGAAARAVIQRLKEENQ